MVLAAIGVVYRVFLLCALIPAAVLAAVLFLGARAASQARKWEDTVRAVKNRPAWESTRRHTLNHNIHMVSAGALMMANLYLMGAEPAINELIVDAIHEHNKTALVKLPEDFAHVRLQDIEPITRLNDHTYTAGARVISDADGFIVPLYIRGYFMKKENRYRAILAVTSDAERNYLKPSLEELAKTSMKY